MLKGNISKGEREKTLKVERKVGEEMWEFKSFSP